MDRTIGKEGTWCSLPKKLQDPELLSKPLSIKEWKAPLYHAHEFMKTEPSPGGVIRAESIWGGNGGENGGVGVRDSWRTPQNSSAGQEGKSDECLKRQMCPGNGGQGRNYPRTEGGRESAVQAKPGEVRAWQGLSPSVGHGAEIPAESRNPRTHGLSAGEDRQWWQCSQMVKPSWVWEMPRGTHTGLLQIHSHHLQSWITAENQEKSQLGLGAEFLSRADTDSDVRFSTFHSPAKEEVRKISHDWSEE